MIDFTILIYKKLLDSMLAQGFSFAPFYHFVGATANRLVSLRHDVDCLPINALKMAKLENELGIQSTYFFRTIPETFQPDIISEIASLGHEIGYHYEDLSLNNGNIDKAYDSFCYNLEKLRQLYPVKTICMHGSPRSRWDSKDIWKKYDYKKLGIVAEPYFDINFDKVFYLTDTGRRWDGWKYSVRDKVPQQEQWIKQGLVFHTTHDIIKAIEENRFPHKVMITTHPQRWTDKPLPWAKELFLQKVKNVVKRGLVKRTK